MKVGHRQIYISNPSCDKQLGFFYVCVFSVNTPCVSNYGIAARRNSTSVRDLSDDSNTIDPAPSEYRVELAEDNDWTATFSYSNVGCVNPTVGASIICNNARNLQDLRSIAR